MAMLPNSLMFSHSLSCAAFNQLRSLLQQIALELGASVFSEADLVPDSQLPQPIAIQLGITQFFLVISPPFSALLRATPHESADQAYWVDLVFDSEGIGGFGAQLQQLFPPQSTQRRLLQQARPLVQPNDAQIQSEFTLRLAAALAPPEEPRCWIEMAQVEGTLRQQVKQERLLNQVATQIRQSLELPIILQTAVDQLQQCLQVDRLVIYRLDQDPMLSESADPLRLTLSSLALEASEHGSVIYEARASESIPSVLTFSEQHCFVRTLHYQTIEQQDWAIAVPDVEQRYGAAPCLFNFLQQAQVRAKLVAPILVGDRLWGLLIAHQCFAPRQWQEGEQRFLRQIAEHLAIAIGQAQLYAEVQQQRQTQELRVLERTQELRDAVLAAQAADRAKSEFLASVSHELRTPLTCIIGMSATLQRWSAESLTERQQHFLQTIHASGEHLLAMINDILDLSQAEAGKGVLNSEEFSLSLLAQQTLKTLAGQAELEAVNLELDLRIDPKRDRFIADPRRIRQILFNLLGNAIKFTPEGGKVVLRAFAEDRLAIFQVVDTGIGIPTVHLPFLFQKFQQLDTSYHRQYGGTGLGLALTKQLVDLHGGAIEVNSTEGIGTLFTVRIPMQRAASSVLPAETFFRQRRGRLVLIEPCEETASLICDVLTAAGYQLVWVLEGATAIGQIEAFRPTVIIMSTQLPDIDGDRLIQRLRQNPATQRLKVIALVPGLGDRDWQQLGADQLLAQPIHPDRLLRTVASLVKEEGV